jgi:multidrug efflux pump subunit AcrA (membrane-fusion protein)
VETGQALLNAVQKTIIDTIVPILGETPMSSESLDRLTIDKSHQLRPTARKGRSIRIISAAALLCVAIIVLLYRSKTVVIDSGTIVRVYPTQSFTLLNASGYVVAQRKAAVASKTTGRLEWIGVEEGSLVKAGQVIARLENKDLQAVVQQGEAGYQNAKSQLEQARAELTDAEQSFIRQQVLLKQGIVSR